MNLKDYYRNVPQGESKLVGRYVKIFNTIVKEVGRSKKILDIGAGDGIIANELARNNLVVCIEINKTRVKRLREKKLSVIEQDIEDAWKVKSNSIDVVIMTEVLEHCFATAHILDESYRVLKKGGKMIATTPNIASMGHRVQILLGREPSHYSHTSFEHIRIFTPTSLKVMMKKSGFDKVRTQTILGFFPIGNFGEIIYAVGEKK